MNCGSSEEIEKKLITESDVELGTADSGYLNLAPSAPPQPGMADYMRYAAPDYFVGQSLGDQRRVEATVLTHHDFLPSEMAAKLAYLIMLSSAVVETDAAKSSLLILGAILYLLPMLQALSRLSDFYDGLMSEDAVKDRYEERNCSRWFVSRAAYISQLTTLYFLFKLGQVMGESDTDAMRSELWKAIGLATVTGALNWVEGRQQFTSSVPAEQREANQDSGSIRHAGKYLTGMMLISAASLAASMYYIGDRDALPAYIGAYVSASVLGKWCGKEYLGGMYRATHAQLGMDRFRAVPVNIYFSFLGLLCESLFAAAGYVTKDQQASIVALFLGSMTVIFTSHYGQAKKWVHQPIQEAVFNALAEGEGVDRMSERFRRLSAMGQRLQGEPSLGSAGASIGTLLALTGALLHKGNAQAALLSVSAGFYFFSLIQDFIRIVAAQRRHGLRKTQMNSVDERGEHQALIKEREQALTFVRYINLVSLACAGAVGYAFGAHVNHAQYLLAAIFVFDGVALGLVDHVAAKKQSTLLEAVTGMPNGDLVNVQRLFLLGATVLVAAWVLRDLEYKTTSVMVLGFGASISARWTGSLRFDSAWVDTLKSHARVELTQSRPEIENTSVLCMPVKNVLLSQGMQTGLLSLMVAVGYGAAIEEPWVAMVFGLSVLFVGYAYHAMYDDSVTQARQAFFTSNASAQDSEEAPAVSPVASVHASRSSEGGR